MSKYNPEFCEQVIPLGKKGLSRMQIAAELNINKATLYRWMEAHKEFSEAMDTAQDFAQAYWEGIAHSAVFNKDYNGNMITWQMMKRFPKEYQNDKQKIELSGDADGAPIRVEVNNAVELAIASLKAQKDEE